MRNVGLSRFGGVSSFTHKGKKPASVSDVLEVHVVLHVLSWDNHKPQCVLLGFYGTDQFKIWHNCEAEVKCFKDFTFT